MGPSVSIVGAQGFIGRWLADEASLDQWNLHRYDLARPPVLNRRVARQILESDYVFWLASRTNPAIATANAGLVELEFEEFADFVMLLEQSRVTPKVLLASSGGTVYDSTQPPPYSETSALLPRHPYAQLKVRMEQVLASSRLPTQLYAWLTPMGQDNPRDEGRGLSRNGWPRLRRGVQSPSSALWMSGGTSSTLGTQCEDSWQLPQAASTDL